MVVYGVVMGFWGRGCCLFYLSGMWMVRYLFMVMVKRLKMEFCVSMSMK